MKFAKNTPSSEDFLEFVLGHLPILCSDAVLYLISAAGVMMATAAQAPLVMNVYADKLAKEASRQIKAEIEAWASESRRDLNGDLLPWPLDNSLGAKKMNLAREFFAAAVEARNRRLRLTYHSHDRTHWIFYPFEPGNGAFYEQVVFSRRREVRRAVSDACDRVIAKNCAQNRRALEATTQHSEDHE